MAKVKGKEESGQPWAHFTFSMPPSGQGGVAQIENLRYGRGQLGTSDMRAPSSSHREEPT
jgi:hypothetical protein